MSSSAIHGGTCPPPTPPPPKVNDNALYMMAPQNFLAGYTPFIRFISYEFMQPLPWLKNTFPLELKLCSVSTGIDSIVDLTIYYTVLIVVILSEGCERHLPVIFKVVTPCNFADFSLFFTGDFRGCGNQFLVKFARTNTCL